MQFDLPSVKILTPLIVKKNNFRYFEFRKFKFKLSSQTVCIILRIKCISWKTL
jgi:hypothetical protein